MYDRGVRRRRRTLNKVNVLAGACVLETSEIAISEEVYSAMVVSCTTAVNDGGYRGRQNNNIGIRRKTQVSSKKKKRLKRDDKGLIHKNKRQSDGDRGGHGPQGRHH